MRQEVLLGFGAQHARGTGPWSPWALVWIGPGIYPLFTAASADPRPIASRARPPEIERRASIPSISAGGSRLDVVAH